MSTQTFVPEFDSAPSGACDSCGQYTPGFRTAGGIEPRPRCAACQIAVIEATEKAVQERGRPPGEGALAKNASV